MQFQLPSTCHKHILNNNKLKNANCLIVWLKYKSREKNTLQINRLIEI